MTATALKNRITREFGNRLDDMPALKALACFAFQPPGFDPCNYATAQDYRRDRRVATTDGALFRRRVWELLSSGHTAEAVEAALIAAAVRKRLRWIPDAPESRFGNWSYIAGQYFCTEYRDACVSLLDTVLHNLTPDEVAQ